MQVGEIEPDGDDGIGEVMDVDIFEIDVGGMRMLDNEILADVASEYDCFDCIHDVSFLILFFLAVLSGPIMPWGLVPELPELGDALAADEWLVEERAAGGRLVEERAVEGVDADPKGALLVDFKLDAWQYLSSPPHVEDPITVVAIASDLSSCLISPVLMHWM